MCIIQIFAHICGYIYIYYNALHIQYNLDNTIHICFTCVDTYILYIHTYMYILQLNITYCMDVCIYIYSIHKWYTIYIDGEWRRESQVQDGFPMTKKGLSKLALRMAEKFASTAAGLGHNWNPRPRYPCTIQPFSPIWLEDEERSCNPHDIVVQAQLDGTRRRSLTKVLGTSHFGISLLK